MIIETRFSMGDFVWDLLRKQRTQITGITVEKQKNVGSESFRSMTLYTIDNALDRSYRTEDELMELESKYHVK